MYVQTLHLVSGSCRDAMLRKRVGCQQGLVAQKKKHLTRIQIYKKYLCTVPKIE